MKVRTPGVLARRAAAAAVGGVLAVSAAMIGAGTAGADTGGAGTATAGKELVVLGDSFTANALDLLPDEKRCMQSLTSWPAQLSTLMGINGTDQVANPSCPGASIDSGPGYTLSMEALLASKAGSFGPSTKLVTLQFGLNDRWGSSESSLWNAMQQCVFDLTDGCDPQHADQARPIDSHGISGAAYAARIRSTVTYIRYYAPNARIVLVGYPELVPAGQETVCLDFFGVAPFVQPRGRSISETLDRIDRAQREAAQQLQLEFLDARALTTGHGLCTADPWVNGVFDPTVNIEGLPFHPSPTGDSVVANALYERYVR
ncbi:SGNH/GDSL hydrolase family protein [Nocardia jejuensis]|uniref:SGNH/GDSL hydrolase family protein n=1 Tax=Nocardia jejuensis TaxID=328049 RepID=UPI0008335A54|nr:SGNH/GDSL hydrolase family protein [Nocardia jejuensis]